jgi:hypothetical protein
MNRKHENPRANESAYFAGAASEHGSARLILTLAVIAAVVCAWALWSSGAATAVRSAEAGPPSPSARNLERERGAEERARALDSGVQRELLISEVRELRSEVRAMKQLLEGGQIRAEVTNLSDIKPTEVKLEIDYAKLRESLRNP